MLKRLRLSNKNKTFTHNY